MQIPFSKFTQHQKILTLMCRFRDKQWWLPQDFMLPEQGDLFVGYEASARLSELGKEYPDMIESQRSGKYVKRRVIFETMDQWLPLLPKDLRYVFHRTGQTAGLPPTAQVASPQANVDPPEPRRQMIISAIFKGRGDRYRNVFATGQTYELTMERLEIGNPIKVIKPIEINYRDIPTFQKEWKAV